MKPCPMPRLFELASAAPEGLFTNFGASLLKNPIKRKVYHRIEEELGTLPLPAWLTLKSKLLHLARRKHPQRGWQPVHDALNEARAFAYLRRVGATGLRFIPQAATQGKRTPDIEGTVRDVELLCEVKTINASQNEVVARHSRAVREIPSALPEHFFQKLDKTLTTARSQLTAFSACHHSLIIFVVLNFDDHLHECLERYLIQLRERAVDFLCSADEVVFSIAPAFYFASVCSHAPLEISCSLTSSGTVQWTQRH